MYSTNTLPDLILEWRMTFSHCTLVQYSRKNLAYLTVRLSSAIFEQVRGIVNVCVINLCGLDAAPHLIEISA
jgi:hypothetical protein